MSGGNPYFALAGVVVSVGISIGKVFVEHTDDIRNFGKRIKKAFMDKKVGHDETGKETVISLPVSFKTFFNWDETSKLFDEAKKNFKTAFDGKRADFMDIGSYIFEGILDGFTGVLGTVIEPFKDFFTWFGDGICEVFGIHSPAKNMKPYGKYIFLGILELTTGLHGLMISGFSYQIRVLLAMCFCSFGGLCIMAQTKSVLGKELSLLPYASAKCMNTAVTAILTLIFL